MFCQTVVSGAAAFTALHMVLSESVPSIRFLLRSCNYGYMLGKTLQTVGERMAFYYDGYVGHHAVVCFTFPFACFSARQPFVFDNGCGDNNSGNAEDNMLQRASIGSVATK